VKAPWSTAPLRHAIYSYLKEPEALIRVLEVIVGWLELFVIGFGVKNSEGQRTKDIPPVSKVCSKNCFPTYPERMTNTLQIVNFLQCLLDATSLTLLSSSDSHALLRRIFLLIQQSIDVIGEEGQLCPHLEPFVGTGKGGKRNLQGKRSRHKKVARKQADWVIGSYRIEALVL
jgi:hypothetical protein